MVKFGKFFFILLIINSNRIVAQSDTAFGHESMTFSIESMPKYSGGEENLKRFIGTQIRYDSISSFESESIVFISCWVDTVGNTAFHRVLKGVREDLDKEALRVARLIKFEEPAKQRGKPVAINYFIPVIFELESRP